MSGLPQPSPLLRWLKYTAFKIDAALQGAEAALDAAAREQYRAYDIDVHQRLVFLRAAALDAQRKCKEKSDEEADRCMTAGVHTTTCADDAANRSDLGCQDVPASVDWMDPPPGYEFSTELRQYVWIGTWT
jgi:hypothetical protein